MTNKLNKASFTEKSHSIHGDVYDYSKVVYKNSTTKVIITCKIHGQFKQRPQNHLQKQGCPTCAVNKLKCPILSNKEFIKKSQIIHKNYYLYKSTFTGVNNNIIIYCPIHGKFEQKASSHLSGKGCAKCSKNIRKTTRQFISEAQNIHKNAIYSYNLVNYITANKKIIITCIKHGDFQQTPSSHLSGNGCLKCGLNNMKNKLSKNTTQFIKQSNKIHNNKYKYNKSKYESRNNKIIITCDKHGDFTQYVSYHLSGNGCPKCAKNQKLTTSDFKQQSNKIHNNRYSYANSAYTNNRTKLIITCSIHGDFQQTPSSHLKGNGCSKCSCSKGQLVWVNVRAEIKQFIELNNRTEIKPYEIDIWVPKQKVGIEFHGNYWHSYNKPESYAEKHRHVIKHELAVLQKISLLQFYEYEWTNHADIIKSIIMNKLDMTKYKIYARKCKIELLKNNEYKKFISNNHLSGYRTASIKIGLIHDDEIVSCLSLSRYKHDYEITRFSNKLNTSVVGGFSKLLTYARKTIPKNIDIVTFADRRISTGHTYKNFFDKIKITQPNYKYFDKNMKIGSRLKYQKHKLHKLLGDNFNQQLTEAQNMFNNDYRRIWDAGNYKFSNCTLHV